MQAGIPVGQVEAAHADVAAVRAFPAVVSRRWNVLPYRIENGRLHVATADIPSAEMTRTLSGLTSLEIQYRLMRSSQLRALSERYLPAALSS